MSLTPVYFNKSCEIKNLQLPHSHIAIHCWRHTVQAQNDGFKQPLNNIEPMSTAFRKLQVLPPEFRFLRL